MSSITRRNGKHQAQVRRLGKSISRTFTRRSDAVAWARQTESDIERGAFLQQPPKTLDARLSEVLGRYGREVLPLLAPSSRTPDEARLRTLERRLGSVSLASLSAEQVSGYRSARAQEVGPAAVLKELGLLGRVLSACRQDWGMPVVNVVRDIRKPRAPRGRDRRLEPGELECLLEELSEPMRSLVTFAIETAMRRGELVAIRGEHVDMDRRTLRIPVTKTATPRTIPLSQRALEILSERLAADPGRPFPITARSATQAFTRACRRAGLEDLHFHDLRHEATSRLCEKGLSVMEVALVTGHADLRMLARYTHLRPEDVAEKLR
jgi:integrase